MADIHIWQPQHLLPLTQIHTHMYVHVHVHACVYIHIHICMYIHTHTHIYSLLEYKLYESKNFCLVQCCTHCAPQNESITSLKYKIHNDQNVALERRKLRHREIKILVHKQN